MKDASDLQVKTKKEELFQPMSIPALLSDIDLLVCFHINFIRINQIQSAKTEFSSPLQVHRGNTSGYEYNGDRRRYSEFDADRLPGLGIEGGKYLGD